MNRPLTTGRRQVDDWLCPLLSGPKTAREIAQAMQRSHEWANTALPSLEHDGLVKRQSAKRARAFVWELTADGRIRAEAFFVVKKTRVLYD